MTVNNRMVESAIDFHGLNQLRSQAATTENTPETLREVAGQFESLFINMMLKSMRQASFGDALFDSNQSKFYRDMSDQQMASDLSANGGLGLQDVILRQLGGDVGDGGVPEAGRTFSLENVKVRPALGIRVNRDVIDKIESVRPEAAETSLTDTKQQTLPRVFDTPEEFVSSLWPHAEKAAEKLGVSPQVLLSQAALETGWGKHIQTDNNKSSFNLFNIKADSSFHGDTVSKTVLEYRDGRRVYEDSHFRAYESYADSFEDYVEFLQTQPRYEEALQVTDNPDAFIEALHEAGYATDPQYSDKVRRILYSDRLAQISLVNTSIEK
jgi:flagellar protein FlgJ